MKATLLSFLSSPVFVRSIPFIGVFTVYLTALPLDLMEIDAVQYASISREMLENHSFLVITDQGEDYLDKPPLLFWLVSLSYALFGVSPASYRLPSLLFALIAIVSVFGLASLYYNRRIARLSALCFATFQATFLMTNDIRTDTMLTGSVMLAVWQTAAWLEKGKRVNLILGAVATGLAMLAKGPIGLMVPLLALGTHIAFKGQWKKLLNRNWLIAPVIIGAMLAPMCWGLYKQYGWEGLKFYFWTQSFGRITGENAWRNDAGPFYFVHNLLWQVLPWTFILVSALLYRFARFRRDKREYITAGGFLLPFIALSMSKYKLPHYIYVTLPYTAVLLGVFIHERLSRFYGWRGYNFWNIIQFILLMLLWAGGWMLVYKIFPPEHYFIWLLLIIGSMVTIAAYIFLQESNNKLIWTSYITAVGLNLLLNTHFYPQVLKYQSGSIAGKYIRENSIPVDRLVTLDCYSRALEFHSGSFPPVTTPQEVARASSQGPVWVYTSPEGLQKLYQLDTLENLGIEVLLEMKHYPVSRLSPAFLNPQTRNKALGTRYLVRVVPSDIST